MKKKTSLRPAVDADADFLETVYIESRRNEFDGYGLEDPQLYSLLKSQYEIEERSYRAHFPGVEFFVIIYGKKPVGRFIADLSGTDIVLIEMHILPEFRSLGVGSFVINKYLSEAEKTGKIVSLHVLQTNHRAIKLYERLGFTILINDGMHIAMQWKSEKSTIS